MSVSVGWRGFEALESRQLLSAGDLDRTFGDNGILFLDDIDRSELAV